MVELDVIDKKCGELFQVAVVVGVEEGGVESCDGAVEFLLILDLGEHGDGLASGGEDKSRVEESAQKR
jgi:hypothetical protein